jgi:hypothetical protein
MILSRMATIAVRHQIGLAMVFNLARRRFCPYPPATPPLPQAAMVFLDLAVIVGADRGIAIWRWTRARHLRTRLVHVAHSPAQGVENV